MNASGSDAAVFAAILALALGLVEVVKKLVAMKFEKMAPAAASDTAVHDALMMENIKQLTEINAKQLEMLDAIDRRTERAAEESATAHHEIKKANVKSAEKAQDQLKDLNEGVKRLRRGVVKIAQQTQKEKPTTGS